MNYTVVCVGKLKERFWTEACAEYVKRLGAYAKVKVCEVADVDPARAGGVDGARAKEGQAILAAIAPRSHAILLAIDGRQRSSEDFSAHLDDLALRGKSDLTFVIGGPVPTRPSRLAPSPCPTTSPAWSCSSRSTAPARSVAASPTTSSLGQISP